MNSKIMLFTALSALPAALLCSCGDRLGSAPVVESEVIAATAEDAVSAAISAYDVPFLEIPHYRLPDGSFVVLPLDYDFENPDPYYQKHLEGVSLEEARMTPSPAEIDVQAAANLAAGAANAFGWNTDGLEWVTIYSSGEDFSNGSTLRPQWDCAVSVNPDAPARLYYQTTVSEDAGGVNPLAVSIDSLNQEILQFMSPDNRENSFWRDVYYSACVGVQSGWQSEPDTLSREDCAARYAEEIPPVLAYARSEKPLAEVQAAAKALGLSELVWTPDDFSKSLPADDFEDFLQQIPHGSCDTTIYFRAKTPTRDYSIAVDCFSQKIRSYVCGPISESAG